MISFGEYVRKLRTNKDWSIERLAEESGVSNAQISRIETGSRGIPKPPTIKKIADALGVDYKEMLTMAGYADIDIQTLKIAEKINSLSDENKRTILDLLDMWNSKNKQ